MNRKRFGQLGRLGIDAILSSTRSGLLTGDTANKLPGKVLNLPIDSIIPCSDQPRENFDRESLKMLAVSIKTQGIIQPVLVAHLPEKNKYRLVAGERRLKACRIAGKSHIPAWIRSIGEEDAAVVSLVENIQRQELNPMERAHAVHKLVKTHGAKQSTIAEMIGCSRSSVSNLLRLLRLHPAIQQHLRQGALEMGHARTLLSLSKPDQEQAGEKIIQQGLSVRQTENLVKKLQGETDPSHQETDAVRPDPKLHEAQDILTKYFNAKVKLSPSQKKGGRITIYYNSPIQLEKIMLKAKQQQADSNADCSKSSVPNG